MVTAWEAFVANQRKLAGKEATPKLKVRGLGKVSVCFECLDLCDEIIAEEGGSDVPVG